MKKKILMLLIIAIFVVVGGILTYALTQGGSSTEKVVELENEAIAECSGDCDGNCNGDCGAADCDCVKKASTCGAGSCPYADSCASTPGACGNTGCDCGK